LPPLCQLGFLLKFNLKAWIKETVHLSSEYDLAKF